jgi:ferric-dicitrate binding protein FerR (iron transport regulator)
MTNKTWSRKFIALCAAAAVLTVYSMIALATPGARSGALSIAGEVTVDGQKVISGGTIFSDSVIVTAKDSSATVSLSKLGRVELSANSSLKLSFTDNSIMGLLDSGRARISTPAGVRVNLTTRDGFVVVDGTKATSFSVNVEKGNTSVTTESGLAELHQSNGAVKQIAAGESAVAGTPQAKKGDDDDHKLSGGALAALLLATGGAVAAIIYATRHNNDLNFGGTVIVVSPTK